MNKRLKRYRLSITVEVLAVSLEDATEHAQAIASAYEYDQAKVTLISEPVPVPRSKNEIKHPPF